ncbi:probable plastidic glucose transporter 2 isoform X3 [Beta vulgaris subsp. vulgaris]|uniref:probable plastidic glucose transporter 2 isoform X3 n=1 Tax=Beta vulgaris subsp. vulgaris TaxID=3555 RepID=UPI002037054C|nr:probable plastidic glucose transporter 2 isoform X3 [Beta vulgaris subsp. vulgaris]
MKLPALKSQPRKELRVASLLFFTPNLVSKRSYAVMNFPTYKRINSRENSETMDEEDNSGFLQNDTWQESGKPSWKRSLPHVLVATLTAFLFGYHIGVVNEPLESISLDLGFKGNTLAEGLVVSTCLGGAFVGCAFSGSIADGFGRRRAFQLSGLPMILGAVMSAMAKTLQGMLLGRLIVGFGMGLGSSVAALYVAEISPAFVRGTYGSFIQIATCLGLMAALVVGIPSKDIMEWWRMCFWLSTIPAATLALGMIFCAESPIWLYKQGRSSEAEAEFEKLLGGSHVHSAMMELEKSDRGDSEGVKLLDLLSGRHSRGSIIAMTLMDKVGRKLLLLWSFLGMAVSMGLQVAGASTYMPKAVAFYLSVGGVLLYVFTFAVGAGPVPGLLLPEIFPSRIRAKAIAFCMSVHWVFNFLVGLLFLRLLEKLGPQFLYTAFSSFCLIAVVFVKKNVIETKGRTLQEIEIALLPDE